MNFLINLRKKNILFQSFYNAGVVYPAPKNLTYLWNFGSLALFGLLIQIVSGIFLAMHYIPSVELAFSSVEHIMRDVNYGWLLRYVHSNGASFFFLVVYIHLFRSIYYGSYSKPRHFIWITGVIILLLMVITAFLGYVLPWGQMSYWAATVITNLVSTIPYIGNDLLIWLWGGYSVDGPTLNRFYSLHYFFPFFIFLIVFIHLIYLHETGSNNILGSEHIDKIPFHPYYTFKDLVGVIGFILFFCVFIYFIPNSLGHPDNYIIADACVTPQHIVPEWYFLPFYALLRSVPDKAAGVCILIAAILILIMLPFVSRASIKSCKFRVLFKTFYWFFVFDCIILGWIGGKPIVQPFYLIGQYATIYYFLFFLILILFNFVEKYFFKFIVYCYKQ